MIQKRVVNIYTKTNIEMEHLYLKHSENSSTLFAMFPGDNYTCDRPLLHYMRKMAINKKYDVLCINYGTSFKNLEFGEHLFDEMANETMKALKYCLSESSYDKIYLIGKSIGTPIIGRVRFNLEADYIVNQIFLTPIEESVPYINRYNGLVITGTNDKLFSDEMIKSISQNPENTVKVFEGANHALELDGDISDTINLHNSIMKICNSFIDTK